LKKNKPTRQNGAGRRTSWKYISQYPPTLKCSSPLKMYSSITASFTDLRTGQKDIKTNKGLKRKKSKLKIL
jgi:hypothetical protein